MIKLPGQLKVKIKAKTAFLTEYTLTEELLHSISHGIGVVLSIAGLAVLVAFAALYGDAWHVVSFSIFGASLIILYAASTLYHSIQKPKVKKILKAVDHSAIYFLIAGSYTPFALVSLRGPWGWSLFGVVWGLALMGIIMKCISIDKFEKFSYFIYLLMGWLCVIAFDEMLLKIPSSSMVFLAISGGSYSLGFLFYAWKRLPYNHFVWHIFVLCGSIMHFFSVLYIL